MLHRTSLVIGSTAVNPPPNVENTSKVSSSRATSVHSCEKPFWKIIYIKLYWNIIYFDSRKLHMHAVSDLYINNVIRCLEVKQNANIYTHICIKLNTWSFVFSDAIVVVQHREIVNINRKLRILKMSIIFVHVHQSHHTFIHFHINYS